MCAEIDDGQWATGAKIPTLFHLLDNLGGNVSEQRRAEMCSISSEALRRRRTRSKLERGGIALPQPAQSLLDEFATIQLKTWS
jgi:hypothetical protein